MWVQILFVVAVLAASVSALMQPTLQNLQTVPLDFDVRSFDTSNPKLGNGLIRKHVTGYYNSTGRYYSGFAAIFHPEYFSFYPSQSTGCENLVKPSESSVAWGCDYATNGGFFHTDTVYSGSRCIGNLVSDGKVWQMPTDGSGTGRANFGITQDNKFLIGFVDQSTLDSNKFTQLITGWGWLVRGGKSYVNASADLSYQPGGFTMEKAPRTAVGYLKNGDMILLEIDGEEDINYGPDLFEMAEVLVSLGTESAINIDGGGSSVSISKGTIIDQPTCKDTPELCERKDASITCVRSKLF